MFLKQNTFFLQPSFDPAEFHSTNCLFSRFICNCVIVSLFLHYLSSPLVLLTKLVSYSALRNVFTPPHLRLHEVQSPHTPEHVGWGFVRREAIFLTDNPSFRSSVQPLVHLRMVASVPFPHRHYFFICLSEFASSGSVCYPYHGQETTHSFSLLSPCL